MAKSQKVTSDYTSIDDLSLPRGASLASWREQHAVLERSNSDSNLNLISPSSWSTLFVDKTFFWLRGRGNDQSARVQVEWDIQDNVGAQDWIGLFHSGEEDTSKFLDCKTRGSSGGSTGTIFWDLDAVQHLFTEDKTLVCFKYISGISGDVLATSSLISVILAKSEQASSSQESYVDGLEHDHFCLTLEDLHATNLKKGVFFNPDPYIKLQILPHNQKNLAQPHHHRELRSSVKTNTANPRWRNEKFTREVLLTDLLEIEVKHKFSKSRPTVARFLGRCTLPIQTITERIRKEQKCVQFNLELMRKSPSDNISGTLGFRANLHLLLNGANIADSKAKSGNSLHRQTSLPNSWAISDGSTPLSSRVRHRHTDPGEEISGALDSICVGSDIEEGDNSETLQAEGMESSNGFVHEPLHIQEGILPKDLSLVSQHDCSVSLSDSLPSSNENSDSYLLSVVSSSDAGAQKPEECSPQTMGVSVVVTEDETEPKRLTVANGDVLSNQASGNSFNEDGLDMSVQSGQLDSNRDAPLLPPRTYKAPPLPPRVYKSQRSPPPLPPRHAERTKKKVPVSMSLDVALDPPPLPPRTYSPIDANDSPDSGEGSGSTTLSGRESSREQELFPWGDSPQPPPPGVRGTPSPHQNSPTSLIGSHSGNVGPQLPVRPGAADNNPGSRGSIALSTISEPTMTTSQLSETGHTKRRSVDDIGASSSPPQLQPRQIRRHLEQWYREKQKNNPTPSSAHTSDGQSSSPGSSGSASQAGTANSSRCTPPPVPPSLSPGGASATARTPPDSCDGPAASQHGAMTSNTPSPQVPGTSSSNSLLPSLPSARDRSNDRRVQNNADGNWGARQRPTKYYRVDDRDDALPTGWEARVDTHGRIFYIDHVNRTTTWLRPQTGHQAVQRRQTLSSEQRQQLDQRYQSIRRTINQSQQPEGESPSSSETREASGARPVPESQTETPSSTPDGGADRPSERSRHSVYKYPAVKFLTRPDFFPILQANEAAMVDYNRNSKLKHMITKMRRDPKAFERYQHNRDLVSFVNLFCDTSKELPPRWEMKYDRSGKAFFIDHVLRTTTFMDPRLPTDVPLINPEFLPPPAPRPRTAIRSNNDETSNAPVPPPRQPLSPDSSVSIPTAYNEKVVLFLQQPNIERLLREKCPQFSSSSGLREKVTKIATRGVDILERFSNDMELTLLLSLFENEIMSYVPPSAGCSRVTASADTANQGSPQGTGVQRLPGRVPAPYKGDFQAKLRNFYRRLESKGYGAGPGRLSLTVRRDHVLEDAFNKIMATPKRELQKHRLNITFAGEEGLDYGGPSREFFFLLSRELFNPYYGLFEYSANDTYTVQVSPSSTFVENAHEWFRFSGRVLGLALVHQYLLDAFFTRPFYKALLRVPLSLEDVESLDTEFHQSLLWIKDNDISEVDLGLTFSVSEEVFGQVTERELKPNGKNISVTERNKKDYIEKMVKWRLERGVTEQTESLIRGFHEVLDSRQVSSFDARELELVIAGTVEIDIADWRRHTDYRSGYHDQDPVIQWFWQAIEKFDNEHQLRLLQFVTGTSSIPYEGFAALRGSNGPRKFCIEKWGKITSLPRAHTCFNRLDLPPYTSFEMLFEKLVRAVIETSTFSID